ncbi:hypothetical protein D1U33_gp069 [Common midwife toad virus]|uniref:Uncharacterized protein n=1 Tax=common midwife toad virus-NL TaxID=2849710 RepID=A0A0A0VDC6_9VIRU|nr:hypothetical protein D1U33_gp069 [Common midwife toad virus]AIW68560.1 hypothetical protein [common midwife toad virus-NL]
MTGTNEKERGFFCTRCFSYKKRYCNDTSIVHNRAYRGRCGRRAVPVSRVRVLRELWRPRRQLAYCSHRRSARRQGALL